MAFEPVVFVVDDDQRACKSVCALVRSLGLRAEAFSSAEEFLARYTPDSQGCLVTDVRMTGMSGLELQDRLAEKGVRHSRDRAYGLSANTLHRPRHEGRGGNAAGEAV